MYADFLSSPEIKTFDFSVFYTLNSLYIKANLNIYKYICIALKIL